MVNFIIGFFFGTFVWCVVWFIVEAKNKIILGHIQADLENMKKSALGKASPPDNEKAQRFSSLSYQVEVEQQSGGYEHDKGVS